MPRGTTERDDGETRKLRLKVERRALKELLPHPKNPRVHPEPGTPQWEALKRSLLDDYFDPIVWNRRNGLLVSGHLRTKVLTAEGFEAVDVVVVDYSESRHLAAMLAANRHQGTDDMAMLVADLRELKLEGGAFDFSGFTFEEFEDLDFRQKQADAPAVDADPAMDKAEALAKKWKTKVGQLWAIGGHRLFCGDSTDPASAAAVLGDAKPRLMVTDPPYGVEYDADWRNHVVRANGTKVTARATGKVLNDDRADWREAWALFPGDVAYVWHAGRFSAEVSGSLTASGFVIRSQIIWAKQQFAIGRGDYHWQHEPCWYVVRDGKTSGYRGGRSQSTLWQIDKPPKSETGHSTQKPLECMARPMRNHPGDVYEPFAGSGTTIVAAQNLGRTCFAIELNPPYVAVILDRMKRAFPALEIKRLAP